MKDDPLEFAPGYVSPLTDKQHATTGRISILWGQIEHFAEHMLPFVTGLSWDELQTVKITDKPIAQMIDLLSVSCKRIEDEAVRDQIRSFCDLVHQTRTQRNHIFHGIWGWRGDVRTKRVFPAARKTSAPSQPFPSSRLSALEKKLCKCSRLGSDLMMHFYGETQRVRSMRYIHHGERDDVPEWLIQWSDRNPWDVDQDDSVSKEGQLPRRSSLYPER